MSDVLNLLDHGVSSQAHFLYKKQPGYEALVMMGVPFRHFLCPGMWSGGDRLV